MEKSLFQSLNRQILIEITEFCESCINVMSCGEEDCVLWRIEQIVSREE